MHYHARRVIVERMVEWPKQATSSCDVLVACGEGSLSGAKPPQMYLPTYRIADNGGQKNLLIFGRVEPVLNTVKICEMVVAGGEDEEGWAEQISTHRL